MITKKKTVLLTGARGRFGCELRRALPDENLELISFSRTRGDGIFGLEDLLTPGLWENADTILHAAWSTVPLLSERNVGTEWQHDLPLLVRLLKSFANRSPRPHFVYFSSGGSVYGGAPGRPSIETDPLHPVGWHGFAKVQAEELVREFCTKSEIPFTILRVSNPYGFPISCDKPQGIVPILIQAALAGRSIRIWGDGHARKDFLHADDFIEALRRVIHTTPRGVFNLSLGESYTVLDLIGIIEAKVGTTLRLEHIPAYPWDVADSRLDNARLCQEIAWRPTIGIDQGLGRCVEAARHILPTT